MKNKITKGEKLLYISGILCFTCVVVLKIFCGAGIGNFKMSKEQIKAQISAEEKNIESLTMQVNELTSYDHVKDIVKDLGLAYNNDNIIVIGD